VVSSPRPTAGFVQPESRDAVAVLIGGTLNAKGNFENMSILFPLVTYRTIMFTGGPAAPAALNSTVASPCAVSAGIRKFTW